MEKFAITIGVNREAAISATRRTPDDLSSDPKRIDCAGACGDALCQSARRISKPTKEHLEIVALLRSFQGRLIQDVPRKPETPGAKGR